MLARIRRRREHTAPTYLPPLSKDIPPRECRMRADPLPSVSPEVKAELKLADEQSGGYFVDVINIQLALD
eukprot:10129615-Alexandrium_andersonii.AAC.1